MRTFTSLLLALLFISACQGRRLADDDDDDSNGGPPPFLIFMKSQLSCTVGCTNDVPNPNKVVTAKDIDDQLANSGNLPKGAACRAIQKNSDGFLHKYSSCISKCSPLVKKLLAQSAAPGACSMTDKQQIAQLKTMQSEVLAEFQKYQKYQAGHKSEVKAGLLLAAKEESHASRQTPVSGLVVITVGVAVFTLGAAMLALKRRRDAQRTADEAAASSLPTPTFDRGNPYPTLASL